MMAVQAQVSPVITERRNSMIAKTCACLAAGVHHLAYLRSLLKTLPLDQPIDASRKVMAASKRFTY